MKDLYKVIIIIILQFMCFRNLKESLSVQIPAMFLKSIFWIHVVHAGNVGDSNIGNVGVLHNVTIGALKSYQINRINKLDAHEHHYKVVITSQKWV